MNENLAVLLEDAIDNYNDMVSEDDYLFWWDVINEMDDMTDDEEVTEIIAQIESETKRLKEKEASERFMRSIKKYVKENENFIRGRVRRSMERYE